MSDTAKVYIAVCAENAIVTICFTVLSVVFHKWWIILFAFLFYTSAKRRGGSNENK